MWVYLDLITFGDNHVKEGGGACPPAPFDYTLVGDYKGMLGEQCECQERPSHKLTGQKRKQKSWERRYGAPLGCQGGLLETTLFSISNYK